MIGSTVMKLGAKSAAALPNHMLNELAAIDVSSEGKRIRTHICLTFESEKQRESKALLQL